MGLWGAAQAIAFGLGGFLGALSVDIARQFLAEAGPAYASVFAGEGLLFFLSALLALKLTQQNRESAILREAPSPLPGTGV